jgi:glycine/D-amino acid oxidase-like deaminating enzyme
VRLARTDEEAEDQRASLADLHADGFKLLETPVRGAVPPHATEEFAAAFFMAEDGEIHPVRFLRGVAKAAARDGARLFSHSAVMAARWDGGRWVARTERATVSTGTLVLATNAHTPLLCPALAPLIAPRRGQMIATAPIDREIVRLPTQAHWGYHYWRQLPDGRLILGGWRDVDFDAEVGYDDRPTDRIQDAIESGLRMLVPEGVPVEHRWAGTMGFARDGRPLVGWLDAEHHLAICAGFTGHGMAMAPACTLDLAELLSWKRAPGIATFDPMRFPELQNVREGLTSLERVAE